LQPLGQEFKDKTNARARNLMIWRHKLQVNNYKYLTPLKENIWNVYRGADKFLARPDWKKQLKGRHFSSDAEVVAAAETWLDGQPSELFLSCLQKFEFGPCSLFPSWSG